MTKAVIKLNEQISMVIYNEKVVHSINSPNYSNQDRFEIICEYLANNSYYPVSFKVMAAKAIRELFIDKNPEPQGVA